MRLFTYLFTTIAIVAFASLELSAQNNNEPWFKDEPVAFEGKRKLSIRSKKKIMAAMVEFTAAKLEYPPMVFSVIKSTKDSLELKAVSEVPSSYTLHPISFRLLLIPGKKEFVFHTGEFYFEDIRLSLDKWLKKYRDSDNKRHQRNVEVVYRGIESHVQLSMNKLAEHINN